MGDECILAPMAFFCPDLLGIKGENLTHVQQDTIVGDAEDPYDDFYLQQTQQQVSVATVKPSFADTSGSRTASLLGTVVLVPNGLFLYNLTSVIRTPPN